MASDTDVPRPGFRSRITGRAILIALGALLFVVVVFGRAIANFYVSALWHDALGRSDVFWGQIGAKITLFVMFLLIFLVMAFVNLWFADRAAPTEFPANVHPYVERFHEVFGHRLRLLRYGTALILALMLALPAASRWQEWLLFRNSKSFPDSDPQFGVNVGFYVFELPFLTFAIDWLFAALVIVLILTIAAHLLNGGVLFTSATPTVRSSTKVHVAVLLAILAAVKAGDYWLSRYELTNDTRGFVQGATYTVVNAQIPALMLLVLIALTTSVLFLSTIRFDRWRLPIVASGLWLVVLIGGAVIYPALVQSLVVQPNQEERESVYIARNVEATRAAMGIADVETVPIEFQRLTATDVESDLEPIRNVRLLNPTQMLPRFSFDRGEVAGLKIDDLDVDRYELDGDVEQVLVTARELDLNNIPNKSWQGEHLVSTRGCGLVLASASQVTEADRPDYRTPELDRPQLYFSPSISGYAIVGTEVNETPCGGTGQYEGDAGVEMSSFFRRAVFALGFLDYNIVGSGAIESDSQILWNRSVEDRLETLAPFLDYDGDPYPVAVDGGVVWVVDAYTSTGRYPYAQRIGDVQLSRETGLSSSDNYVRNSVKATVDAYTGEVTFYAIEDEDPILQAWSSAFPDLFTPGDEMPDELREHLRYPEDLFRVQTDLYSKYQIAPQNFFQRIGAWSVAQAPSVDRRESTVTAATASDPTNVQTEFASESDAERFIPYYTMFRDEETGEEEFVILRPFVPFSTDDRRTELQAYMTASSDPDTYGEMTTYVVEQDPLPAGPLRVADQAESDSDISPELSLLANDETGTQVKFGDMQPIPVADGLVYIRPVYVVASDVTEFRLVIVSHNNRSVMEETLDAALARLFPGYEGEVGERIPDPDDVGDGDSDDPGDDSETGEPADTDEPDEPSVITGDAAELVSQAEALYNEAQDLLRDGDLGGYQQKIDQMGEVLAALAAELDS
ncbi:hypothetical protein BDK89_0419 [Ilumatobacter fluminis]|uniref:Uncharacterized protein n=1 Tax=Ilumatobacter fluminis TaxID=467091 RepID=A0A4R7HV68_9ACTN|nr:UPF0182 family protein [Ilumatobacter fluminis]TDT14861.1 hypothetical protein BDK89_0419 [Ilumatobacter fluminis]